MSNDQEDSTAAPRSEVRERLPEEIVRYVEEASSQERQAIKSLIDEVESEFENAPSKSDGSESQPESAGQHSPEVSQKNETKKNETSETSSSSSGQSDDPPDDVPANATLTVKEINNNRYYYWQWRDGDSIRSKYKAPVQDQ